MRTYVVNGDRYRAEGPTDLVRQMAAASFAPSDDLDRWVELTAQRATEQTGRDVRHDSFRNFVTDLIAAGLVRID